MGVPTLEAVTPDNPLYQTNNGPLASGVTWTSPPTALEPDHAITITWTVTYDPT
jgi:hypothetical protein